MWIYLWKYVTLLSSHFAEIRADWQFSFIPFSVRVCVSALLWNPNNDFEWVSCVLYIVLIRQMQM